MKYFVYILQSEIFERFYIGQTSNLEKRLKRHNAGESFSTQPYRPWKIIYFEEYSSRTEAMKRERYLKSPAGWHKLQNIKATSNKKPQI